MVKMSDEEIQKMSDKEIKKMFDKEIKKMFEHALTDLVSSLSRPVVTENISAEDFAYAIFRAQEARCNFESALLQYAQVFHRLS